MDLLKLEGKRGEEHVWFLPEVVCCGSKQRFWKHNSLIFQMAFLKSCPKVLLPKVTDGNCFFPSLLLLSSLPPSFPLLCSHASSFSPLPSWVTHHLLPVAGPSIWQTFIYSPFIYFLTSFPMEFVSLYNMQMEDKLKSVNKKINLGK